MKQTGKCPKCGSADVIADAKAVDRGHGNSLRDLAVATFRKPQAIFFTGRQETSVSAWVCLGCGYVEFYADYPAMIQVPKSDGAEKGEAVRFEG